MSDAIAAAIDAELPPKKQHEGPAYPDLGSGVAKYRRMALKGIASLLVSDRRDYGNAVLTAVQSKQRQELQRETPTHRAYCASGTNHNTGEGIIKAIQQRNRAALTAAPSRERRARPPEKWKEMYQEAMKEKCNPPAPVAAKAPPPPAKKERAKPPTVVKPTPIVAPIATKAEYEIVKAMKGKFIVAFPRNSDGSKSMNEIIASNQLNCRFSHTEKGYITTADQLAKLDRIIAAL